MNQVFSIDFAQACINSGLIYGVTSFYLSQLLDQLPADQIYVMTPNNLNESIISLLLESKVKYIEFTISLINRYTKEQIQKTFDKLKKEGCYCICKGIPRDLDYSKIRMFDAVVVKDTKGAGHSTNIPIGTVIQDIKKWNQKMHVIASGGIHSSEQAKHLFDLGASAVSIGTLFAASRESPLSDIAKQQILKASSDDLSRFSNGQQALVFSNTENDDENNTTGLRNGIETGTEGHLFMGHAVDHITKIRPVSGIVSDLRRHLV